MEIYQFFTGIEYSEANIRQGFVAHRYTVDRLYIARNFSVPPFLDAAIQRDRSLINFQSSPYHTGAVYGRYFNNNQAALLAVASYIIETEKDRLGYLQDNPRVAVVYRYFYCEKSSPEIDPMLALLRWYIREEFPTVTLEALGQSNPIRVEDRGGTQGMELTQLSQSIIKKINENQGNLISDCPYLNKQQLLQQLPSIISSLNEEAKRDFSWIVGIHKDSFNSLITSQRFRLIQDDNHRLAVVKPEIIDRSFQDSDDRERVREKLKLLLETIIRSSLKDNQTFRKNLERLFEKTYPSNFWQKLFKAEFPTLDRDSDRMKDNSQEPSIRFLILKAILIPETIEKLIEFKNNPKIKKEPKNILESFEKEILEIMIDSCSQFADNRYTWKPVSIHNLLSQLDQGGWIIFRGLIQPNSNSSVTDWNHLKSIFNPKKDDFSLVNNPWEFSLKSRIVRDFYLYFNQLQDLQYSLGKDFFETIDKSKNTPKHDQKSCQILQEFWDDIDPVISAYFYHQGAREIPVDLWDRIDNSEYWRPYIEILKLRAPNGRSPQQH